MTGTAERDADRRWRVRFILVLMLGMGLGPFVSFGLGALSPLIAADLDLSPVQVGALPASQALVAGLTSGWVGRLTDRTGGRRMLCLLFAVGVAGLAGMAGSRLYVLIAVGAALTGFCLAASNPATNLLVRDHLPRARQGMAMGMKQSGVTLTIMIAGLVLPSIGVLGGWRAALGAAAAVAVVGGVAALRVLPAEPRPAARPPGRRPRAPRPRPPTSVFRGLRWMSASTALIGATGGGVAAFMPFYAVNRLGASVATGGFLIAIQGVVGMVCRIAWGRHLDASTSVVGVMLWLAGLGCCATLLIAGAAYAGIWMLWLGAALFGASGTSWNSVAMLAVVRSFDAQLIGAATGIVFRSFFGGMMLGPLVLGGVVDRTGSFVWAWLVTAVLMAGAAGVVHRRRGGAEGVGLFEVRGG